MLLHSPWARGGILFSSSDTTPDAFTFTDQTNVATSSTMTSAAITVTGIDSPATITVSGGTYDINASGTFVSSSGTVSNGDTVRARHTSSASNSTATNTTVTIGGVSDTFTSTTVAAGGSLPTFYREATFEFGTNGGTAVNSTDGVDVNNGGMTVSTTRAHAGTKSAECSIATSGTLWGGIFEIPRADMDIGDEVWIRHWCYIPSTVDFTTGDGTLKWFRWRTRTSGAGTLHATSTMGIRDGGTIIGLRTESESSAIFDDQTFTIPTDEWVCWEYYIKIGTGTSGTLRSWVNGTLRGEVLNCNTAGVTNYTHMDLKFLDFFNNGSPQNQSVWIDKIQIATSKVASPTNQDASGNFYIGTTA